MEFLFELETENDPIVPCRLLNVLRRKGIRINTFTMTAKDAKISIAAVFELPEEGVEHIFNFLRRMEGVDRVSYRAAHSSTELAAGPAESSRRTTQL